MDQRERDLLVLLAEQLSGILSTVSGSDGADGVDGTDGADGTNGLSAYEIAVANGFVGSEIAWLASLIGATGATGATGAAGATGATGATGASGSLTPFLEWAANTYILLSKEHGVGYAATANGSFATSAGMMRYYSWVVPVAMSVKALALSIETANADPSAVWRAGLYADNGSGLPGTLLVDGGTASINTTGVKELSFSPISLTAGTRIWFCSGFQGFTTGTNPQYAGVTNSTSSVAETGPVTGSAMFGYYEKTGVTGALGNNPGPSIVRNVRNSCPHVWLKVA